MASGTHILAFAYAPDRQRVSMTTGHPTLASRIHHLGFDPLTHSEMRLTATDPQTSPQTWVDYLDVAGETIGQVTTACTANPCTTANKTVTTTGFASDHLGSVVALNTSATATSCQNYDAWGSRATVNGCGTTSAEHRGYIGEEQLDGFGLINLNRRLYDPRIGRFLGADPIARGFFANPQGLNRYAYAGNMPLSASDPTGFEWFYEQGTGLLTHFDNATGKGDFIGIAESGTGRGFLNPAMDGVKNVGPLPSGGYT
jgi:RHS repeat-associated protein